MNRYKCVVEGRKEEGLGGEGTFMCFPGAETATKGRGAIVGVKAWMVVGLVAVVIFLGF